jgi:hypothetical protein
MTELKCKWAHEHKIMVPKCTCMITIVKFRNLGNPMWVLCPPGVVNEEGIPVCEVGEWPDLTKAEHLPTAQNSVKPSTLSRRPQFLSASPWDCSIGLVSILVYFRQHIRFKREIKEFNVLDIAYNLDVEATTSISSILLVLRCLLRRILLNSQRILISQLRFMP